MITSLTGPDPLDGTPDNYIYTPAVPTTLSAGTTYWLTAGSFVHTYSWVITEPQSGGDTGTGGWSIGDNVVLSNDQGGTWLAWQDEPALFAVSASAVPETSTALGTALAAAGLLLRRRRASDDASGTNCPD